MIRKLKQVRLDDGESGSTGLISRLGEPPALPVTSVCARSNRLLHIDFTCHDHISINYRTVGVCFGIVY